MLSKAWILVAIGVVLVGCGGAGSTGGVMPNNTVRRNIIGDTYGYTVSGTYSQSGVVTNGATSGTATDIYSGDTYNGATALEDIITTTIALQSGPMTFIDSRQYDASTFVTLAQSDAGTLETVNSGAFTPPATLTSATSLLTTEVLANGTQVSIIYNVTGAASVLALNGTSYNCWVIHRQVVFSDGLTSVATIDFSPDLGAAVKTVQTDTYSNGYSDVLTSTLNSSQFGISPQNK